jgi:WD40 repeat protein
MTPNTAPVTLAPVDQVRRIALSADGSRALVLSGKDVDCQEVACDEPFPETLTVFDTTSGRQIATRHEPCGLPVVWSGNGRVVLVGCDTNAGLWRPDDGNVRPVPVGDLLDIVALTKSGERLLVRKANGVPQLVDSATGGVLFEFPSAQLQPVAMNAEGSAIAALSSTGTGTIELFDTQTGRSRGQIAASTQIGELVNVRFTANDTVLAVTGTYYNSSAPGCATNSVTALWSVETMERIGTDFCGVSQATSLTPDGSKLVGVGIISAGTIPGPGRGFVLSTWDLTPGARTTVACAIAGRNLTNAEWTRYMGNEEAYRKTCPAYADGS